MMTEQELRQLAVDIKGGSVFTSNHIPPEDTMMLGSIFMPLFFMTEEQNKDFMDKKPALLYEYMREAGPRSVNGYPIFMSMKFVTEDELPLLNGYYKELLAWEKGTSDGSNEQTR